MARLIYSAIMSLDGYIADAEGNFDWAAPDEEVHAFVNDLERPVGTYLYGRRMYETMRYWETAQALPGQRPVSLDFARIWQAADKVVYSSALPAPDTARTRVERDFDPDQIRKLKEAAGRDLTVGGAHLAAQAIAAGLVDEYRLFTVPAIVGGGTRALPDHVRLDLALADQHRFGNGTVYLCYRPAELGGPVLVARAWPFLFHSWWTRPLGEVTDSMVKRSSRPLVPSQRDTPRPRVTGTTTRCMKSTRPACRNWRTVEGPPPMRTSRPPAASWARRSTRSGGPSTNRKLVPLGKSIAGRGWWVMTNTGVRNGGSSPHQPRHPSSGHSPAWGRPPTTADRR
jgi:dihydrofolate reductase